MCVLWTWKPDPSSRVGLQPFAFWDWGFDSRRGHGPSVSFDLSRGGLCVGLITCPEEFTECGMSWVWLCRLDSEETLTQKGLSRHGKKKSYKECKTERTDDGAWTRMDGYRDFQLFRKLDGLQIDWHKVCLSVTSKSTLFFFRACFHHLSINR